MDRRTAMKTAASLVALPVLPAVASSQPDHKSVLEGFRQFKRDEAMLEELRQSKRDKPPEPDTRLVKLYEGPGDDCLWMGWVSGIRLFSVTETYRDRQGTEIKMHLADTLRLDMPVTKAEELHSLVAERFCQLFTLRAFNLPILSQPCDVMFCGYRYFRSYPAISYARPQATLTFERYSANSMEDQGNLGLEYVATRPHDVSITRYLG